METIRLMLLRFSSTCFTNHISFSLTESLNKMVNSVLGVPSLDEEIIIAMLSMSMGRHRHFMICLVIIHFSQKFFPKVQLLK